MGTARGEFAFSRLATYGVNCPKRTYVATSNPGISPDWKEGSGETRLFAVDFPFVGGSSWLYKLVGCFFMDGESVGSSTKSASVARNNA